MPLKAALVARVITMIAPTIGLIVTAATANTSNMVQDHLRGPAPASHRRQPVGATPQMTSRAATDGHPPALTAGGPMNEVRSRPTPSEASPLIRGRAKGSGGRVTASGWFGACCVATESTLRT